MDVRNDRRIVIGETSHRAHRIRSHIAAAEGLLVPSAGWKDLVPTSGALGVEEEEAVMPRGDCGLCDWMIVDRATDDLARMLTQCHTKTLPTLRGRRHH
jgi:hypothetical protein